MVKHKTSLNFIVKKYIPSQDYNSELNPLELKEKFLDNVMLYLSKNTYKNVITMTVDHQKGNSGALDYILLEQTGNHSSTEILRTEQNGNPVFATGDLYVENAIYTQHIPYIKSLNAKAPEYQAVIVVSPNSLREV